MKVPLSWLKEYVDIQIPVAELVERLTIAGLEVESARLIGAEKPDGLSVKIEDEGPIWDKDKIVIAEILKVEQHPNADRLTLPEVDLGDGKTKGLVTGAPNIKVGDSGQKVVVALRGSVLFDGHAKEKKLAELKPGKIRGIESDAMVCSEYELGITEEHAGIIILENDAPVGTPAVDVIGDIVLNIDVLPNMARCMSMIGIAREVAALTGAELKLPVYEPEFAKESIEGLVRVLIDDPKLSARYSAMLIRDVSIKDSPAWMQRRLSYAGMRPVNNIVDITNYVMLEWGQPLHAFDYDKLKARAGEKKVVISVRPAKKGEKMTTLDDIERKLTPENLLIADEAGPVALAGVMGGAETEVSEQTKHVLLESASFNQVSIRVTSRTMNLPSEASARFSRGVHPETVKPAALRAAMLMGQFANGQVADGMVDTYPAPIKAQETTLIMDQVERLLGIAVPIEDATRILETLEFKVKKVDDHALKVTTPSHRLDIQVGAADLIEELARIYGYDRLPETLLDDPLPDQVGNPDLDREERVRNVLAQLGFQEVINYSLTTPEQESKYLDGKREYVKLQNPISSERIALRQSVVASVLEVVTSNLRHTEQVEVFEIGKIYVPHSGKDLPDESRRLVIAMTGKRETEHWDEGHKRQSTPFDFFDLKGVIEALVADLHLEKASYRPSATTFLHPGQSADLLIGKENVGSFGLLHPGIQDEKTLGSRAILIADLDLEAILPKIPFRHAYRPVSRYAVAKRDIAIIVPEDITGEQIEKEIFAAGGKLLREATLFDLYRGESIEEGCKSLAYALTYQSDDHTLSDKEIEKAHKKVEGRLKHQLKAKIRGKED